MRKLAPARTFPGDVRGAKFSRIGSCEGTNHVSNSQLAHRSRDEVASAICSLTPAQWKRLEKVATKYAFARSLAADDVLQEALTRAVDSRVCPAHVDIVRFVAEAIRSIAHGESEKAEHKRVLATVSKSGAGGDEYLDPADASLSPEDNFISEEEAARIRSAILALFEDDPIARDIVEGTMAELTAEELREMTNLSLTDYNTKRRLIRRRIDSAFPDGWKK